jgi:predicted O-methyltransferase YrrM
MVELGTSAGISAMYQAAGNTNGKLYTLEGCPQTSSLARKNFLQNDISNIECITGNFDDTLEKLLDKIKSADYFFIDGNHTYEATIRYFNLLKNHCKSNSLIIFDDINWSQGMLNAWEEIKLDSKVTITLDFHFLGLAFFNPDFSKQNFKLRLK